MTCHHCPQVTGDNGDSGLWPVVGLNSVLGEALRRGNLIATTEALEQNGVSHISLALLACTAGTMAFDTTAAQLQPAAAVVLRWAASLSLMFPCSIFILQADIHCGLPVLCLWGGMLSDTPEAQCRPQSMRGGGAACVSRQRWQT